MVEPTIDSNCRKNNDTIYVRTIYNFSYTHAVGDTIIYSFEPQNDRIKRAAEYLIEDLNAEVIDYMKSRNIYSVVLSSEQSKNGIYIAEDARDLVDDINRGEFNFETKGRKIMYLLINYNSTREYDGTSYGSLTEYNWHTSLTSYTILAKDKTVCYFNGIRTFAYFSTSKNFYRKSVSHLFNPYFNSSVVKINLLNK